MKFFAVLFNVLFFGKISVSEYCETPLGEYSNCIPLYDCPQFVAVLGQKPIPKELVDFLRQSQCGSIGNVPQVCCGPTPYQPQPTSPRTWISRPIYNSGEDPVVAEDSYPSSQDQCGVDTNGDRLYGGVDTEIDEFPWMALLGYQQNDPSKPITYKCAGVLLNSRYVLSAAHCVFSETRKEVENLKTVRLGEYDMGKYIDCINGLCADPVQDINIESVHSHSGYSEHHGRHDISLIRLAKRAQFSYFVAPICLTDKELRLDSEVQLVVAGWGATLNGTYSPVKQKLILPLFSHDECVAKFAEKRVQIQEQQICAGGIVSRDSCKGDSGGPLMKRTTQGTWEVVGVVSFGYGCGKAGWPAIYTSVPAYLDWIKDIMRSTNV